jgi:CheY-like chemotaxis protein
MSRKKILIVDDDKVICKALGFKLKASGYEVLTAEEPGEALTAVRTQQPDLVIMDINFPPAVAFGGMGGWDGFLTLDWLKRTDSSKNTPVIVISGGDPAKYQTKAVQAGAVNYFQKPVNPEALLSAIRKALGEPPVSKETPTAPKLDIAKLLAKVG